MAIQALNTIKKWFQTGLKPSQNQFWDTWDSFRHKLEKVPLEDIEELEATLNTKAEKSELEAHKNDKNAHSEIFAAKEDKSQKGLAGGYVPLNEFSKIAHQYLNIINNLTTGGATSLLSAEQGVVLQNQINAITSLLSSDNIEMNTLQKIVDTIEQIQMSLDSILVNDLTTGDSTKALTAEMGKLLETNKEDKSQKGIAGGYAPLNDATKIASQYLSLVNDLVTGGEESILSAEQGKILQNQINGINAILQSDNVDLDTIQEIVDAIEQVQISLDTILVNDLTTGGMTKALTAEMGKYLDEIKANLESPEFTGIPTAPTVPQGTITTQIATTEFVKMALDSIENDGVISVTGTCIDNTDPKNPVIQTASATQAGVISTISLQELGGADKFINGVRVGRGAGNNQLNTAIGSNSITSNKFGYKNTAVGYATLSCNISGNNNTTVGFSSLYNNETGNDNTALGYNCISNNTTGSFNIGIGSSPLTRNTTGNYNIAIGNEALYGNTVGYNNIGLGNNTLKTNSTGFNNIAIGKSAGENLTSGFCNIFITSSSSSQIGITTGYNNTIIGGSSYGFNPNDSYLVVLGDGGGNTAIRKEADNRLLAPTLRQDLIITGGSKSLINKEYADNMGATVNTTTINLSSSYLNNNYYNALLGFRVHCKNIDTGGLIYEKTSNGWLQYPVSVVN